MAGAHSGGDPEPGGHLGGHRVIDVDRPIRTFADFLSADRVEVGDGHLTLRGSLGFCPHRVADLGQQVVAHFQLDRRFFEHVCECTPGG